MFKSLPNIEYRRDERKRPYIDSDSSLYTIPFFKPDEYLSNIESCNYFIGGVEKLVRGHDRYSKYKKYLMEEVRLDHCQVLKDLTNLDCDIELHHGPIFTLYDIVSIVIEYFRLHKWKISTFRIADQVLTEHEANRVNCVMLASTIHEQVHNRNIFISMKQAWGDTNAFVDKYYDAISPEYRMKYNRYVDQSMMRESEDYGTLELNDALFIEKS